MCVCFLDSDIRAETLSSLFHQRILCLFQEGHWVSNRLHLKLVESCYLNGGCPGGCGGGLFTNERSRHSRVTEDDVSALVWVESPPSHPY
ncbi:hypothetical protein AVEN_109392-1 [Araneus ventricosus]|uniref:Uncharacterized protein n=1 Tax=Araneus ventricosus TaxID=182803 RepID=A0A4Y2LJL0_ARAVE|nr:hypothetical protein AVEN_109392-1 [Araneus ventricosus]